METRLAERADFDVSEYMSMDSNLIGESPNAMEFLRMVGNRLDSYRLYPGEQFDRVAPAIMATDMVDRQGDRFTLEALRSLAEQVNESPLWLGNEHNPLFPPQGRVIAAGVFFADESKCHFIAGVIAYYPDPAGYGRLVEDAGKDLEMPDVLEPVDEQEQKAAIAYNPHEIPKEVIDQMLCGAPKTVGPPVLVGRKSADPMPILAVAISLGWLLCVPFAKKFGERLGDRLGEATADRAVDLLAWLSTSVFARFSEIHREALFEFVVDELDCRVEFIVPSRDRIVLVAATETVHRAARRAKALVDRLAEDRPRKVVYVFDEASGEWWPHYVVTCRRGVLRDERFLIVLERFRRGSSGD